MAPHADKAPARPRTTNLRGVLFIIGNRYHYVSPARPSRRQFPSCASERKTSARRHLRVRSALAQQLRGHAEPI
jgi:hypothetical protein